MGVLFLGSCFVFGVLISVACFCGGQHDLCSSRESLSKLGTGLLVAGLALGAAGGLCLSWGVGYGGEEKSGDWGHRVSQGGLLVSCLSVVLEAGVVSSPVGSLHLSSPTFLAYLACICSSDWCGLSWGLGQSSGRGWWWGAT